jgi:hypothetical protein
MADISTISPFKEKLKLYTNQIERDGGVAFNRRNDVKALLRQYMNLHGATGSTHINLHTREHFIDEIKACCTRPLEAINAIEPILTLIEREIHLVLAVRHDRDSNQKLKTEFENSKENRAVMNKYSGVKGLFTGRQKEAKRDEAYNQFLSGAHAGIIKKSTILDRHESALMKRFKESDREYDVRIAGHVRDACKSENPTNLIEKDVTVKQFLDTLAQPNTPLKAWITFEHSDYTLTIKHAGIVSFLKSWNFICLSVDHNMCICPITSKLHAIPHLEDIISRHAHQSQREAVQRRMPKSYEHANAQTLNTVKVMSSYLDPFTSNESFFHMFRMPKLIIDERLKMNVYKPENVILVEKCLLAYGPEMKEALAAFSDSYLVKPSATNLLTIAPVYHLFDPREQAVNQRRQVHGMATPNKTPEYEAMSDQEIMQHLHTWSTVPNTEDDTLFLAWLSRNHGRFSVDRNLGKIFIRDTQLIRWLMIHNTKGQYATQDQLRRYVINVTNPQILQKHFPITVVAAMAPHAAALISIATPSGSVEEPLPHAHLPTDVHVGAPAGPTPPIERRVLRTGSRGRSLSPPRRDGFRRADSSTGRHRVEPGAILEDTLQGALAQSPVRVEHAVGSADPWSVTARNAATRADEYSRVGGAREHDRTYAGERSVDRVDRAGVSSRNDFRRSDSLPVGHMHPTTPGRPQMQGHGAPEGLIALDKSRTPTLEELALFEQSTPARAEIGSSERPTRRDMSPRGDAFARREPPWQVPDDTPAPALSEGASRAARTERFLRERPPPSGRGSNVQAWRSSPSPPRAASTHRERIPTPSYSEILRYLATESVEIIKYIRTTAEQTREKTLKTARQLKARTDELAIGKGLHIQVDDLFGMCTALLTNNPEAQRFFTREHNPDIPDNISQGLFQFFVCQYTCCVFATNGHLPLMDSLVV